jgi:hypothetical protein
MKRDAQCEQLSWEVCLTGPTAEEGITLSLGLLGSKEKIGHALLTHPELQVPNTLAPSTQAGAAFGKGAAVVLHAPQLLGSSLTLVSQPSLTTLLQSLYLSLTTANNSAIGFCEDVCGQQAVMCCHKPNYPMSGPR